MLSDPPLTDLDGIKPGPVIDLVAIVEIHVLFHGARVDASESPDSRGKIAVGGRSVLGPQRYALTPIAIETPTVTVIGAGRVHEASKSPFTRTKAKAQQKGKRIFSNSRQDSFMRASLLSCHSRVRHRANLYCNEMPGNGLCDGLSAR